MDTSALVAEVDALQGVVPSAIALIDGFTARMQKAVDEAVAANDAAALSENRMQHYEKRCKSCMTCDLMSQEHPRNPSPLEMPV